MVSLVVWMLVFCSTSLLATASTAPEQIHISVGGTRSTGMYVSWFTQVCARAITELVILLQMSVDVSKPNFLFIL